MAYDFTKFKGKIKESQDWLTKEFTNIRTGRASSAILDSVRVESYGNMMSLPQVAQVVPEDAQSIRISPWDKSLTKEIEKSILAANLGVSVTVDDKGVRVIFPSLTSERREQIMKIAKDKLEEAKKRVRVTRDDLMKEFQVMEKSGGVGKDDVFRYKAEAQKIIDGANKTLDEAYGKKEKEILS